MKIIVFGATGGTGREIVRQAAAQGHSVTAFVRNPARLPSGIRLRVIEGDVFDPSQVVDAVWGNAVVLSALGSRDRRRSELLFSAVTNMITAMEFHSIPRLIVLGAAGAVAGAGKYQSALSNAIFWSIRKTLLRYPFEDQSAQEKILASSLVDYTIVRPPRLTDGPLTRSYRVLPDALPSRGLRISRSDVADFMLAQLTDPRFHRQGVYIAD